MYLYRTVIPVRNSVPGLHGLYLRASIPRQVTSNGENYTNQLIDLDGHQIECLIEFADMHDAKVHTPKAILKAVMHDERGTWIRYAELTPPRFIEHAHYVNPLAKVRISNP